eukprot:maker-scaffold1510_size38012-snap-gene-0.3 protein:Tk06953 transcript:maker-scaffold1510_size38012-snap-gene-0.3-mRNA-1 annotation:"f0f1 atp synthase subunit alpha"
MHCSLNGDWSMQLNSTEISDLIKQRIESFDVVSEARNEGTIVSVSDGILSIHGLADVMQGEMIELPGGRYALALNLNRDSVGAVVMGPYADLQEGMKVTGTGRILEVPVGPEMLGRVVNTLGEPIDGKGPIEAKLTSPVEIIAPGVIDRKSVDQPVQTGYKSVDSMIPIGRGQRELVIGDRQTGKTAMAIDAIINQKDSGIFSIYVAIGQKASTIANVVRKLEEHGALANTVVVVASASESAALQYLAPYAGCAMGEYFRDRGEDALIVYDDLSKQAIFLQTELFNAGVRPAVDPGISVSRVGGSAQTKIIKKLSGGIRTALAQYRELAAFAQFSSDLDEATKKQLDHGQKVTELMKQKQYAPMSVFDQALVIFAAERGYLQDVELSKVLDFEAALLSFARGQYADLATQIDATGAFNKEIEAELKKLVDDFKATQTW